MRAAIRTMAIAALLLGACGDKKPAADKPADPPAAVAKPTTPTTPPKPAAPTCAAGMALLDGGSFTSKRGGAAKLDGFCLDQSEVTVAAYQACVDGGACTEPDREAGESCNWGASGDPPEVKRGEHPVNCVDHAQAVTYCEAQGRRLPTADELEWAQRGGAAATIYPWGNDEAPSRICADAAKHADYPRAPVTCAVGACAASDSPHKIHDLSGNLAEWTATSTGEQRLVCGGQTSCQHGSVPKIREALAAGACLGQDATQKFEGVGFRCAGSTTASR